MGDRPLKNSPHETTPTAEVAEDCSLGLRVFGALTVLLGGATGLSAYLMMFAKTKIKEIGYARHILPVMPITLFAATVAAILIWLGIGVILARRWARALLLVFSCIWLGMGSIALGFLGFIVPKTLPVFTATGRPGHPSVPPAAQLKVMVLLFVVFGFVLVILPAVWVLFFRRRQVAATCARCDPVSRWTDARPLPVLGTAVWLLMFSVALLIASLVSHGVMPNFGTFLTGGPGMVAALLVVAALLYGTWALLQLRQHGWWLVTIVLAVLSVSAVITFLRHDISQVYQVIGYPQPQIDRIRMSGALEAVRLAWLTAGFTWPFLVYLVFVKKFLRRKS